MLNEPLLFYANGCIPTLHKLQHKAAVRNRYVSCHTAVHSLDSGHQFAFDEAQIIGQAQTKAGRLFMEAIYSDENSINRHITLDPCYALIKDRLTR